MTNSKMNPKVDEFLSEAKKWKEEYESLRKIVLDCELTEDFNILPKEVMERNVLVEKFLFVDYGGISYHSCERIY